MKNKAKKKSFLRQQITSMVMTLMVVFCSTAISATMWFQQSYDLQTPTQPYQMRLELVRDLNQPFAGENLLWSSGVEAVLSLDTVVTLPKTETAHLVVSNLNGYEDGVLYQVEVLQGETTLFSNAGKKNLLSKGQSVAMEHIEQKEPLGDSVRIVLHTALATQSIYTASTIEDLTQKKYPVNSVVYATGDILAQDVVFEHNYPNLNLVGHTFSCKTFTLSAPKGVYGTIKIGNGSLIIGEKRYTTQDTIKAVGEGNVILELYDLQ